MLLPFTAPTFKPNATPCKKDVFYGCTNDKFRGCGSILSLHLSISQPHERLKKVLQFSSSILQKPLSLAGDCRRKCSRFLIYTMPDIELVFYLKSAESIWVRAAKILSRLDEAAREIVSRFENVVLREPPLVLVPGGTIHPLTRWKHPLGYFTKSMVSNI